MLRVQRGAGWGGLLVVLLAVAVTGAQRYQSIDEQTFDLYSAEWTSLHSTWVDVNPDIQFCDTTETTTVYPLCLDGLLVKEVYADSQLTGDQQCPAAMCLPRPVDDADCSYTPFDSIDYLPPAPPSSLDNHTLCAAALSADVVQAEVSASTLGMDLGIPPLFLPLTPLRLNITGRVLARLGGQCMPVEGAVITAWQVDPTQLSAFTPQAQREHEIDAEVAEGSPLAPESPQSLQSAPRNHSLRAVSCIAVQHADAQGGYSFLSVVPPSYGPPRHVMFQVAAPGYQTLTTRMYLGNDWRLLQMSTGSSAIDPDSLRLALGFATDTTDTANNSTYSSNLLGAVGRDPRVAAVTFRADSAVGGLVTGTLEAVFPLVLRPTRAEEAQPTTYVAGDGSHGSTAGTATAAAESGMPPVDISGLWADASGALVLVETHGPSFLALQYPHARTWGAAAGVVVGESIRGVDLHQVLSTADVTSIRRQEVHTYTDIPSSTTWTAAGASTGTIVPSSPYSTAPYSAYPEAASIQWSTAEGDLLWGVGADNLWTRVPQQAVQGTAAQAASVSYSAGYRYLKLLVTRETGGSALASSLILNEVVFFEGVLGQRLYPRADMKMLTPRTPAPQMVTCSSFLDQDHHCYKAFDGDASSSSAWISKPLGGRRHEISQWATLDLGEGRSVRPTGLRIVCNQQNADTDSGAGGASGCPMSFQLLGSTDNVKFDLLYREDLYDHQQGDYGTEGRAFYFVFDTVRGRIDGQRCGSCSSGPSFSCHVQAYDSTCASRYCGDSLCAPEPPCPAGEYMQYGFEGLSLPAFRCMQCGGGRYGNTSGLTSSYCSGLCTASYYCPPGSTAPTQLQCAQSILAGEGDSAGNGDGRGDGSGVFCPEGSGAPIAAAAGRRTIGAAEAAVRLELFANNSVYSQVFLGGNDTSLRVLQDAGLLSRDADEASASTRVGAVLCRRGHYCAAGKEVPCPVGTYGNITGLRTALCSGVCEDAFHCPAGAAVPVLCPLGYYCPDGKVPVLCPAGTYGGSRGLRDQRCSGLCSAGHYCPAGSTAPTQQPCPQGRYGSAGLVNSSCSGLCTEGYFCGPGSNSSTQEMCGASGLYCPEGSYAPTAVSHGYYSIPVNVSKQTRSGQVQAEVGFYASGLGERWPCPSGSYGATAGLHEDDQLRASFAPSAAPSLPPYSGPPELRPTAEPTAPSAPTVAPSTAAPTATPGTAPTAQPTQSEPFTPPTSSPSSPLFSSDPPTFAPTLADELPRTNYRCSGLCAPGYYCPQNATSATQAPCPAGRYGSTSGLTSAHCTATCPLGHYCPPASVQPTPCPAGLFGNSTGLIDQSCSTQGCWEGGLCANTQQCEQGHYCPLGSVQGRQTQCGGAGLYCPLGSAAPLQVKEGYYSLGGLDSNDSSSIDSSASALRGAAKASTLQQHTRSAQSICEEGYFCEKGIRRQCPRGTFGSSRGLSSSSCSGLCAVGHYCPEGTSNATSHRCPAGRYGAAQGLWDSSCSGGCKEGFSCPEGSVSPTQLQCAVLRRQGVAYAELGLPLRTFQALPQTFPRNESLVRSSVYLKGAHFNVTAQYLPNTNVTLLLLEQPNSVFCPNGTASPLLVRRGYYSAGGNRTTRFLQEPCPQGAYCVQGVVRSCPAGRYGRGERLTDPQCTGACSRGHYCPPGSTSATQEPCPVGRYGATEGLATASCSGPCERPLDCPLLGSTVARPRSEL